MDRVGEYLVKGIVGEGGMGVVYEGLQPLIGKRVAIKLLKRHAMEDPRESARLVEEARAVNAIGHRGIVDIFSFGELQDGRQYFVMEYLNGVPLSRHIRQHAPLPVNDVLQILDELLAAVGSAHDQGVVHRDLKPSNVFLVLQADGSSYVKVLDFGLAKRGLYAQGQVNQTSASHVMGTPEFMAPEQIRAQPVSGRTDLYSIGVLAFEMFTGRLPFQHESVAQLVKLHLEAQPPVPSSLRPNITPDVDKLVLKLLEKDPAQRPRSCEQVRQQIKFIRSENHFQVATRLAVLPTPDEVAQPKVPRKTPAPKSVLQPAPPRAQTPPKGVPTWAQAGSAVDLKRPAPDVLSAPPPRVQTPPKGSPTWSQPGAVVDLKRPTPDVLGAPPPRVQTPPKGVPTWAQPGSAVSLERPSGPKPALPPGTLPAGERDTDRNPPAPPANVNAQTQTMPKLVVSSATTLRMKRAPQGSGEWWIRIGLIGVGALAMLLVQAFRETSGGPPAPQALPRAVIAQAAPLRVKEPDAPVSHRGEEAPAAADENPALQAVSEEKKAQESRPPKAEPPRTPSPIKLRVKGLKFVTPETPLAEAVVKRLAVLRGAWFGSRRKTFPEAEAPGWDLALKQCETSAKGADKLEAMRCLDEFVRLAFDDQEPSWKGGPGGSVAVAPSNGSISAR